ncbi:MAG: molybdenum cofactor guanylyltransferase [Meiothermus sp.]
MRWSGAVLAGGQSSRFGRDKARYPYRGKPLLQWVLEGLRAADERFIVAGRDYAEFGVPVYGDLLPGGGSLSGLHAALAHAQTDWVAVAACDQPFLGADYWSYLLGQLREGYVAVVPSFGEAIEPLGAVYHKGLQDLVSQQLRAGNFGLQALLKPLPVLRLPAEELAQRFGARLFTNLNVPEDRANLGEP